MRKLIVLAVLVAVLLPATPAAAAEGYTMTPSTTVATGSVVLKSVTPCPEGEPGLQLGIRAQIYRWSGRGFWTSFRPLNADRSWAWTMVLPTPYLRNGRFLVTVACEEREPGQTNDQAYPYFAYEPKELVIRSDDGQPDPVVRLAGNDRVETAIAASKDVIADGKAGGAVLARSDSYADSLAGTPLASAYRGPLLLTAGDTLDPRTAKELTRVFAAGTQGTVALLGGTAAISQHVEDQLKDLGYQVERYGGLNRYATATRIATTGPASYDGITRILVADGNDFHDGLVAGAAARSDFPAEDGTTVVLLTNGARMPDETSSVIRAHTVPRFAIGLAASKADPGAIPVVGDGPVGTAVAVAKRFFPAPRLLGVTTTRSFADALAGGLHAALTGGPLLYTEPGALPAPVDAYLVQNKAVVGAFVYGGLAAVSEPVRQAIVGRIS